MPRLVVEAARLFGGHRRGNRVRVEVSDTPLEILDEQCSQVLAHAVADQYALDHQILANGLERIGRDLPAAAGETVRQVVQGKARVDAVLDSPRYRRDAFSGIATVDNGEWP